MQSLRKIGGNVMVWLGDMTRRHIIDYDPSDKLTPEEQKEFSRIMTGRENRQAVLSATKGNMSFVRRGHPEALKQLGKTFESLGFEVVVR